MNLSLHHESMTATQSFFVRLRRGSLCYEGRCASAVAAVTTASDLRRVPTSFQLAITVFDAVVARGDTGHHLAWDISAVSVAFRTSRATTAWLAPELNCRHAACTGSHVRTSIPMHSTWHSRQATLFVADRMECVTNSTILSTGGAWLRNALRQSCLSGSAVKGVYNGNGVRQKI